MTDFEAPGIAFRELAKPFPKRPSELTAVRAIASELRAFLDLAVTRERVHKSHVLGASSAAIQEIMLEEAHRLGFQSERKGLFASYANCGIRPDYYRPIGASGILMEVERGKTLANNMDLLDFWKCHICSEADYLFLIVPKFRPTGKGHHESMFARVTSRLEILFKPANVANVEAAFVFGY